MYTESDEELVERWIENPYCHWFCGEVELQHEFPIGPNSMNLERTFSETIATGLSSEVIKSKPELILQGR